MFWSKQLFHMDKQVFLINDLISLEMLKPSLTLRNGLDNAHNGKL